MDPVLQDGGNIHSVSLSTSNLYNSIQKDKVSWHPGILHN